MDFTNSPSGRPEADGVGLAEPPVRPVAIEADVAVVGAGLAGALLALVLARRGVSVAIADLHAGARPEFRCEKFSPAQVELMERLGVADAVAGAFPPGVGLTERGFRYDQVVGAVRKAWPPSVRLRIGRVNDIAAYGSGPAERQRVASADGDMIHARLAVLATGPSPALAARLGLKRTVLRDQHSLCIGFSLAPREGERFGFDGLVHPGERAGDAIGFASFFPLGEAMRVNLFSYHDPRDPWVQWAKRDPLAALLRVAPGLSQKLHGARVVEPAEVRVTDLHRVEDSVRSGLILIGDAFQTSCPSTAFGVTRLLTDIEALVARLPDWLATPGMAADKLAGFYADPVKTALDATALAKAQTVRSMAVETGMRWRARRLAVRLKRRLQGLRSGKTAQPLLRGQEVEVASAAEIAATLDARGRLEGLPFMPEMAAFAGKTLTVYRRADKTCVEGHGLRAMRDTVLLEAAHCDGAAHNGCERQCLMMWKTAWLRPAGAKRPTIDPATETAARLRLAALPTRDGDRYLCQSTGLLDATDRLPGRKVGHLLDDLRRGEITLLRLAEIAGRTAVNMARARLGLNELGAIRGEDGRGSVKLDLRPGERVRIKSPAEIAPTLDDQGRSRGLTFEPEMATYAGRTYTVLGPVKRIIAESSGKMVEMKSTVALEGVTCQGRCTRNCPRSSPLYWRETWLERVEGEKA